MLKFLSKLPLVITLTGKNGSSPLGSFPDTLIPQDSPMSVVSEQSQQPAPNRSDREINERRGRGRCDSNRLFAEVSAY
jgi:hypothetical protein